MNHFMLSKLKTSIEGKIIEILLISICLEGLGHYDEP
ncbi:hypothetical protein Misp06_02898 [Microbulbifer sp. NBRC 101763]